MKLSTENQELLDGLYPDGYEIKKVKLARRGVIDEAGYYHILFVKIFKTGGRNNKLSPMVQKISVKDWDIMKRQLDKGWKLAAITGYDEYAIIHDPTEKVVETKAKPGPKPANK